MFFLGWVFLWPSRGKQFVMGTFSLWLAIAQFQGLGEMAHCAVLMEAQVFSCSVVSTPISHQRFVARPPFKFPKLAIKNLTSLCVGLGYRDWDPVWEGD